MKLKIGSKFFNYCVAGIMLFSLSCSRHIIKSPTLDEVKIYPAPPDTTRIQYLTSITTSADIVGTQSSFKKFLFGEKEPVSFRKPFGVTVHKSSIYICDTGLGGLVIINIAERRFEQFIPTGKGQLKLPLASALDERDFLYIADGERAQIVVFDEKRQYVHAFGESGEFKPTDVFVFDKSIWVVNIKSHSIYVYDNENFELQRKLPVYGPDEEGHLFQPTNIFITDNLVYVTDFGDFKIKKYTHEGTFTGALASYGKNIGQVARPKGIAVDRKSNLFVVDAAFENVQIFNDKDQLLMFFGGPYNGKGDMYLPADVYIDYGNLDYFRPYVNETFDLKYLIFITNQYGPDKLNVYGFVESYK